MNKKHNQQKLENIHEAHGRLVSVVEQNISTIHSTPLHIYRVVKKKSIPLTTPTTTTTTTSQQIKEPIKSV